MSPPSCASTDRRLLELLHSAREGDADARAALNTWLRSDPLPRARLARLLADERALVNRLREEQLIALLDAPAPALAPLAEDRPSSARRPRAWWTWAAAALIALGFFGIAFPRFFPSSAVAAPKPMPVAVLQEQAEASWRDAPPAAGAALPPGGFSLLGGLVAIEFNNGARVLVEGPADFEILSADHVFFRSGRLSAEVPPPAHGFTISTPTMRVVDLGTRFGLSLSPEGTGILRVEKGEVEIHKNQGRRNLKEGDALAFDRSGEIDAAVFPDSLLPSEADLRGRLAIADTRRARRWGAAFDRLSREPAALLACGFNPASASDRVVANLARQDDEASAVTLVGAAWTEGRWPGKSAVEFRGLGDRLRLQSPGAHAALTLLCWARVDSLPNDYNGLLIPNGYGAGAVQWMLRRDGQLRFSMVNGLASPGTPEGWDRVIVAPAVTPLDFGRWIFLATTYDSTTGRVVHYRDGVSVGEGRLKQPLPAVLGSMGVGNWAGGSIPSPSDASSNAASSTRNFVGRLDELAVLSRVLSPEELHAYYEAGRP